VIVPNKFTSLDRSIIAKLDLVVAELGDRPTVRELYRGLEEKFETIQEFILALDVLYILDRINVNFITGTVSHVD
jgi:hypothetical protein